MNTHDLKTDGDVAVVTPEVSATPPVPPVAAAQTAVPPHENLAYAITDILRKAGHPRPERWMQGLHPDTWASNDPNIQRFHINRHLRVIVAQVESDDTMDVRFCLVDNGKIADWLRLFEDGVAKWFANRDLPRTPS